MAAPSTITTDSALETLDEELTFTLSVVQRYDFAAKVATDYESMLQRCDAVALEQRKYRRAMTTCQGQVAGADMVLDSLVDKVDIATMAATDKDPSHPLRKLLFGTWRPSELKRPTLGAELEAVRSWPHNLVESGHASLAELAPQVNAAVVAADAAVEALSEAQNANRAFRLTGNRRQLIDAVNALRVSSYAVLQEYQLSHPQLNLPKDFAGQCFRRVSRGAPATVQSLDDEIASLKSDLASLTDKRTRLIAEQQAAAQAQRAADQRQLEDEIATLQKVADESAMRLAALKAKLPTGAVAT